MKVLKCLFVIAVVCSMVACNKDYTGQWVSIKPGKSLRGWDTDGNKKDFGYVGDTLLLTGQSTIYYSGRINDARFKNFELLADIKTEPNAVAALWLHSGDVSGYQVLINNTPTSEERRKTGSLSNVRNIYKSITSDNEWFTLHVKVVKKHITVKVNNILIVDYVDSRCM